MPSQKRTTKSILLERDHFIGEVVDLDDPQQKLRARIKVYGLMDDISVDDLPWAIYWLPPGCRYNEGEFRPCKVGDTVWIDFPHVSHGEKDTRRPRITGSVHWWPEMRSEYPEIPHEAFVYGDQAYKATKPMTMGTASKYHESHVFTHNNVTMEFVQDGAWRVWNRNNGAAVEITASGDIKVKGSGVHIEGKDVRIEGDSVHIKSSELNLNGMLLKSSPNGDVDIAVDGKLSIGKPDGGVNLNGFVKANGREVATK